MQNVAEKTNLRLSVVANNGQSSNAQIDAGRDIVSRLLAGYTGKVAVQLWDGNLAVGEENADCRLVFHHPGALRDLILHRDLEHLTEFYLAGQIDVVGDMEGLFTLAPHLSALKLSWRQRWQLMSLALRLPASRLPLGRKHPTHANGSDAIAHHYDVGNDFYRLWLDPEMVYSCAYFLRRDESLAEAQRNKLDYICRKLRLSAGMTLLDIGCGWGALAIWAARYYGVQVHGITLSEAQYRFARQRVEEEGLSDRVRIELLDYRDLPQDAQYDRVVSVGMFEHIGIKNFPSYFSQVKRVLKPEGLFLNHGISNEAGWQRTPLTRFINHYIFPDGELTSISNTSQAMEAAGFELVDVEALRRHYALTLRHWVKALVEKKQQAVSLTSEESYRLWKLYMAGCAYFFDAGEINVYQVLVGHAGQALSMPLTRNDLYHSAGV
ncbi:MAG TPA: methyltransferase domain-containing protein [Gammaproteobacteria bacterium]|nr:methyltransferase domain-containing protein [Gammaproteobacteria bacterium]